ncbi:MerR family transcriptional regulator [Rothia sp. ZJ1223]|uniref:MerR family transcriptional regulator n=1 Tax=Rothia sp. ZJ1223 TaxID=2811098 RepID=UPI0019599B06|nr:MerR family transcriptional regulator [Rothia sp. ZJ1223]MBM7051838.1 MerR family transcriptional regulator [Rothia sp. ZJ1223]
MRDSRRLINDYLTVGEVARLVGVSVRALHHWDAVGLLTPHERSSAGYRVYCADDIDRLHRILVYRELGFSLEKIQCVLADGERSALTHLQEQKRLLQDKISHLTTVLETVNHLMEENMSEKNLTATEKAQAIQAHYADEVRNRWSNTDAYNQSQRNTARFTDEDWQRARSETEALEADAASAKRAGVLAGSEEANALAERHRASINRYYNCSHAQQVLLGCMYVADVRFAEHYDAREPGLARWLREVIDANAKVYGVDPASATWE